MREKKPSPQWESNPGPSIRSPMCYPKKNLGLKWAADQSIQVDMFFITLSRSYANHFSTTNNIKAEPLGQCFSNKDNRTSLALLLLLMVMAKQETGNDVKYRDRKLNSDVWNGQRRERSDEIGKKDESPIFG